jgi:hypothetical protein
MSEGDVDARDFLDNMFSACMVDTCTEARGDDSAHAHALRNHLETLSEGLDFRFILYNQENHEERRGVTVNAATAITTTTTTAAAAATAATTTTTTTTTAAAAATAATATVEMAMPGDRDKDKDGDDNEDEDDDDSDEGDEDDSVDGKGGTREVRRTRNVHHSNCFDWDMFGDIDASSRYCHDDKIGCLQYIVLQTLFVYILKQLVFSKNSKYSTEKRTTRFFARFRSPQERRETQARIYILVTFLVQDRPGAFNECVFSRRSDFNQRMDRLVGACVTLGGEKLGLQQETIQEFVRNTVDLEYGRQKKRVEVLQFAYGVGSGAQSGNTLIHIIAEAYDVRVISLTGDPTFGNDDSGQTRPPPPPHGASFQRHRARLVRLRRVAALERCYFTGLLFPREELRELEITSVGGLVSRFTIFGKLRRLFREMHLYLNFYCVLMQRHVHSFIDGEQWCRIASAAYMHCSETPDIDIMTCVHDAFQCGTTLRNSISDIQRMRRSDNAQAYRGQRRHLRKRQKKLQEIKRKRTNLRKQQKRRKTTAAAAAAATATATEVNRSGFELLRAAVAAVNAVGGPAAAVTPTAMEC